MKNILKQLSQGNIQPALQNREMINNELIRLISSSSEKWSDKDWDIAETLMNIANISYNYYDSDMLPIEDGLYDLFSEMYKKYKPNWFGATPVYISPTHGSDEVNISEDNKQKNVRWYRKIDDETYDRYKNLVFTELLSNTAGSLFKPKEFDEIIYKENITKRLRDTDTTYPELVGTLDKFKYVLNIQAEEKNVANNSNVSIFERDYMNPLINQNIIDTSNIKMLASLKYDGVSIVATCSDIVLQAETRGDTQESVSSDVTPIFYGYRFPYAEKLDKPIGIKFEAIMTHDNLRKFNELKGYNYKNCRTAIIGLLGSSDAWKYRDLVTLVPLQTNLNIDRLKEVEFLNKYYVRDVRFNYCILSGNYVSFMYQVKRYVEEAEFCRQFPKFMYFMYDGVVLEFIDPHIKQILGRSNSVNKFCAAIKFNPLKKQTIFTGYTFTVGKTGLITPKIHFIPVEFFGTIHPQSSGHSYKRFHQLNLAKGDIIDVEYVNDVITYVSKPNNSHNDKNPEPKEVFIEYCPSCGSKLFISESAGSAKCLNINCPERKIKIITAAISILGINGFAEEKLDKIGIMTIPELFDADVSRFNVLGPNDGVTLRMQLDDIKSKPIHDYTIMSALGIEDCSTVTWRKICKAITIKELILLYINDPDEHMQLFTLLVNIKDIGQKTANKIIMSLEYLINDINWILSNLIIIDSKGTTTGPKIRITGCRDKELLNQLSLRGCDATDGAVTKDTAVLIIPFEGYNQGTKVRNAKKYGITMYPIDQVRNMDINKFIDICNNNVNNYNCLN